VPLRHESRQKIQAVLGVGAIAARVYCFLLPRLRRNLSGTQKLLSCDSDFSRPKILGRQNPRKQACFGLCHFLGDVKKRRPYTPVGAEWDAIAIRLGTPASRWVLNGTQLRSE